MTGTTYTVNPQAEQIRTAMVGLGEELAEKAMTGEYTGAVLVLHNSDGTISLKFAGISGVTALGSLNLAQIMCVKGMVS